MVFDENLKKTVAAFVFLFKIIFFNSLNSIVATFSTFALAYSMLQMFGSEHERNSYEKSYSVVKNCKILFLLEEINF